MGKMINELKRGSKILTKEGQIAEIMDNKNGVRRMIKIANFNGGFDIGDEYIYKFDKFWNGSAWEPIEMSEHQRKQCDRIKYFMKSL